ncbi:MAG: hypothetical protein D6803_02130 [Anaerolineae bacterium]|nr:MAG: hypothetical protein D6803_02130 [Anaerolineae bacterium]
MQVYWRGEWDAGPLYFATPNALIRLEGAWSAVLYNAQSGETALWLEAGQATLLGSGGQPAVEVQGPGDGETVALVMVSPDGEVGEPQPVGPDVLAERFGAANALSNYFTVVAVVSGPYPPEARSDPQTFWKDHPWAVLLDTDGDSETGFPAMFPHERGLGQDAVFVLFDQLLYIMYTADGQSQPYAGQPPQVYQISDSALAFSFSISSLEEVLGDRLQPENLA